MRGKQERFIFLKYYLRLGVLCVASRAFEAGSEGSQEFERGG